MPIVIRQSADPLSERSYGIGAESAVIVAQSDAARVLRYELARYCRGQTQGRSFLIAGHRGAGKTTAVADVLLRVTKECAKADQQMLRPLPVLLHGPSLFTPLPSDRLQPPTGNTDSGLAIPNAAGVPLPTASGAPTPTSPNSAPFNSIGPLPVTWDIEGQAEIALKQVILGLHRATIREFVRAFRNYVLTPPPSIQALPAHSPVYRHWLADRAELAAQFEIEIYEDPPASRLREFWDHAGALPRGVLPAPMSRSNGARELVALNGICNAHQRLSGQLSGSDKQSKGAMTSVEGTRGFDLKVAEVLKPITALLSGAAVGGGAAALTNSPGTSVLLGGIATVASAFVMKRTTVVNAKRERAMDTVFIPDLTVRTLDRILPTLLERLRDAGLAPVFVIDELDKIDCLSERIIAMVHYLKKLFAETVFTCFLTDRGYMEYLRVEGKRRAYSVAYSYFSHPLLIAYEPRDIDQYLSELLEVTPGDQRAVLDLEVFKWVLRHRSQMHALDLARELTSVRSDGGEIAISAGLLRTASLYKLDTTFQVAIELALSTAQVVGWKAQRPAMFQTLIDALYYISRMWLRGDELVNLGRAGESAFHEYMRERMNLSEVMDQKAKQHHDAGATDCAGVTKAALTGDDLVLLTGVTRDVATFLSETANSAAVSAAWPAPGAHALPGLSPPKPEQSVLENLLLGDQSVLYRNGDDPPFRFRFRYWPSGMRRDQSIAGLRSAMSLHLQAQPRIAELTAIEAAIWQVLRRATDPDQSNGAVYSLLSDEVRVLPTSPAWSQVALAIARLENASLDVGSASELENDLTILTQFRDMVTSLLPTLEPLWVTSAFLGGMRGNPESPEAIRFGLALLSAALGFASMGTEAIISRVADVRNELERWTSTDLPRIVGAQDDPPIGSETHQHIDTARLAGLDYARTADWPALERAAWDDLERRITGSGRSRSALAPNGSALVCAAGGRGPGAILPLSQQPNSFIDYTRLLTTGLSAATGGISSLQPVSVAILAYALRRLGVGSLNGFALHHLGESIGSMRGMASDEGERLTKLLNKSARKSTGQSSPQIAIVIAQSVQSSTLMWVNAPTRGMVLVVLESEADALLAQLVTLFQWWPTRTVSLVWEAGSERVGKTLPENVLKSLPPIVRLVRVQEGPYLDTAPSQGIPTVQFVASPDGADQLLTALEQTTFPLA